jgi:hypothetical protein
MKSGNLWLDEPNTLKNHGDYIEIYDNFVKAYIKIVFNIHRGPKNVHTLQRSKYLLHDLLSSLRFNFGTTRR